MPRPTRSTPRRPAAVPAEGARVRPRPRRIRRSSIAGTGGGHLNTGRGGPGGEARPSPGSSPPGTPDLRGGAEVTVTTGPVSDAIERLQSEHREILALLDRGTRAIPRVKEALEGHARELEEVFYPALREAAARDVAPVITDALVRQRAIARLLAELAGLPAGAERRRRFELLRTRVQDHFRQEEDTVFPEALRRLERPRRLELGERMDLLRQRG